MALLAGAEQILRLNGYEVEAGAVARIVDGVRRLRAEREQLRQALRQTLLTHVVADDAYDREASADRAMRYVMDRLALPNAEVSGRPHHEAEKE